MYSVILTLRVYPHYFLRRSHMILQFFWTFVNLYRHVPNSNDYPNTAPQVNRTQYLATVIPQ